MASELKLSGSTNLETEDEMAHLARTIRDKILIDEPVKEDGLIDIEADHDTGNDHIRLTQKGKDTL